MAGIYIHVPFCHHKCAYCDFYSVGKNKLTDDFSELIVQELELRKEYLPNKNIETIYFGGGTPSLLSIEQLGGILNGIKNIFQIAQKPEITIEVNPDDLTIEILQGYKSVGINRISIGVQSFIDEELRFLGRRHDSKKAVESIQNIYKVGFTNVSIDLIYGIPNSTLQSWEYSLSKAFEFNAQHLSCYHLTYEESTPLTRKLHKGVFNLLDEELSIKQFDILREKATQNGFIHYEISNFAKVGFISQHNSSYWHGVPYLGVGPSAHSFNNNSRQWNPTSINEWSNGIKQGRCTFQFETLDETSRFNELLLTRLRTIWGVDFNSIANDFSKKYINHLRTESEKHLKLGNITIENDVLKIPPSNYLISDAILTELLFE